MNMKTEMRECYTRKRSSETEKQRENCISQVRKNQTLRLSIETDEQRKCRLNQFRKNQTDRFNLHKMQGSKIIEAVVYLRKEISQTG
jgi:hypothetical protein